MEISLPHIQTHSRHAKQALDSWQGNTHADLPVASREERTTCVRSDEKIEILSVSCLGTPSEENLKCCGARHLEASFERPTVLTWRNRFHLPSLSPPLCSVE